MTQHVQQQSELCAVLNLIPYMDFAGGDDGINVPPGTTLQQFVTNKTYQQKLKGNKYFELLKTALDQNPQYGSIQMVEKSSTNSTDAWKDDLIQGYTFKYGDDYYVAFRGTGDGRWMDNGAGMVQSSTEMQQAAQRYFDRMAEKYFAEAHINGSNIYVTGHSKGGNEAQFVYMNSEYDYLISECYNMDGQGFSKAAIDAFIKKHGEEGYKEKLQHMYSICGENDYVHDLGYVIIPKENTYFVKTEGEGFAQYHDLANMVGDENGQNFHPFTWATDQNENIINGEQGPIGQLAAQISHQMMQMDDPELQSCAIAVMSFLDMNNEILGNVTVDGWDYLTLFIYGTPIIVETLLLTPEGNAAIVKLIEEVTKAMYEKYGLAGIIAAGIITSLAVVIVTPILGTLGLVTQFIKTVVETAKKIIGIAKWVINTLQTILEFAVETAKKILEKLHSLTWGGRFAQANPHIRLNTTAMYEYASRIKMVNNRIASLDDRLDSLYWQVGLKDLWNLMQADILTNQSWRLSRCASYLNTTASDFDNVENTLIEKLG